MPRIFPLILSLIVLMWVEILYEASQEPRPSTPPVIQPIVFVEIPAQTPHTTLNSETEPLPELLYYDVYETVRDSTIAGYTHRHNEISVTRYGHIVSDDECHAKADSDARRANAFTMPLVHYRVTASAGRQVYDRHVCAFTTSVYENRSH